MKKAAKIIFILSFLPLAFLLGISIFSAFAGFTFLFSTDYGWEAFVSSFGIYGIIMCTYVPVIPVCALYQLMYGLFHWKWFREKLKKLKISPKAVAVVIGVFAAAGAIGVLWSNFGDNVTYMFEKAAARNMYYSADERIDYNKNDIHLSGMMGIDEQRYDCILLDYSKHRIGFIVDGGYANFTKVELAEAVVDSDKIRHIKSKYPLQAVIPLSSGGTLYTFYRTAENNHRTTAVLLEMSDGTVYFADYIREKDTGYELFTGLRGSEFYIGDDIVYLSDLESNVYEK